MKRAWMLALILVTVTTGVMIYAAGNVEAGLKDVEVSRTDYIGDISAMDGVSLEMRASLQRREFWNIRSDFDKGDVSHTVSTEFRQNRTKEVMEADREGIALYTDIMYHDVSVLEDPETGKPRENLSEFEKMIYDYVRECPETGSFEKRIRLSDYEGTYAFDVSLNVNPDVGSKGRSNVGGNLMINTFGAGWYSEESPEGKAYAAFKNYFRLPFVKDHYATIHVEKDQGYVLMVAVYDEGDDNETAYHGYSTGVTGEKACYFAVSNRTSDNRLVDTGRIPGGYGIYMLPFQQKGELGQIDFQFEKLCTLIPMDEKAVIEQLMLSRDESKLFVKYRMDGEIKIATCDANTGRQIKEVVISDNLNEDQWLSLYEGDGLCIAANHQELTLLKENEEGVLEPVFKVVKKGDEEIFPPFGDMTCVKLQYDGSRLVIAGLNRIYAEKNGELSCEGGSPCSYFVCAVNEDGIQYLGAFESGLDKASMRNPAADEEEDYRLDFDASRDTRFSVGTWDSNALRILSTES